LSIKLPLFVLISDHSLLMIVEESDDQIQLLIIAQLETKITFYDISFCF